MPSFVTSDGVTLHYTDSGPAANTPAADRPATAVLVAGFLAAAATWLPQVDALRAAGHRAVCIDRRSHGRSQSPAYGQRMARHAKDVAEVLDGLGLDHVVAVGGSMGASTWWSYLDLFGPGRLQGLLSVDQTPKMLNADGWDNGFYGFTPDNAGRYFNGDLPDTGHGPDRSRMRATIAQLMARVGPDEPLMGQLSPVTQPLLRDHALQDWRDVVARVDLPLLMVAASDSQYWPAEHAFAAAALAPDGRAVVIPDSGHPVNFDQPEAFSQVLTDFVAGVAAR
jgi:pimeloyl-ACP methyl ester carboxylesterase